jgi:formyl-CoA transferase
VTEWTSRRTIKEIVALLFSRSVPCAPIYTIDELVNDPHIAGAREMVVDIEHPLGGSMKVVSCPIKFSATKTAVRTAAPRLGEHTTEVLTGILGKSEEECERLSRLGVFGSRA